MIIKICKVCKKTFETKDKKRKYCSRDCYYKMKRIRGDKVVWTKKMKEKMSEKYKGDGNPMYGKECWCKGKKRPEMTGKKHPNYKRGYWIKDGGYKIVGKIPEHRLIMEKYLGRKMLSEEIIHHLNGNKSDNDIDNLIIMTRAEHMKIHNIKPNFLNKK